MPDAKLRHHQSHTLRKKEKHNCGQLPELFHPTASARGAVPTWISASFSCASASTASCVFSSTARYAETNHNDAWAKDIQFTSQHLIGRDPIENSKPERIPHSSKRLGTFTTCYIVRNTFAKQLLRQVLSLSCTFLQKKPIMNPDRRTCKKRTR